MLRLLEEPLTLIFDKVNLARTIVRVEDEDAREEGRREFIRFARKWCHFFLTAWRSLKRPQQL